MVQRGLLKKVGLLAGSVGGVLASDRISQALAGEGEGDPTSGDVQVEPNPDAGVDVFSFSVMVDGATPEWRLIENGEVVMSFTGNDINKEVPPGEYDVEVTVGSITMTVSLTVEE